MRVTRFSSTFKIQDIYCAHSVQQKSMAILKLFLIRIMREMVITQAVTIQAGRNTPWTDHQPLTGCTHRSNQLDILRTAGKRSPTQIWDVQLEEHANSAYNYTWDAIVMPTAVPPCQQTQDAEMSQWTTKSRPWMNEWNLNILALSNKYYNNKLWLLTCRII